MEQIEAGSSELSLTHSWFSLKDFELFANELRDIETVESVLLRSNQINDQMVVSLARSLENNKSIKKLYLSDNFISDIGARAIAQALKRNKSLELLYLNENRITNEGARALIDGLLANYTLKRLFIVKNPITIDMSLEYKVNLRCDYAKMLVLSSLSVPRLARKSHVYALPNDVLRVIKRMLLEE